MYNEKKILRREGIIVELKNTKVGFIGYGNMAQAMATGWVKTGAVNPEHIYASARNFEKLKNNCKQLNIIACKDAEELVEQVDIVILAVKPHQIAIVVESLKTKLKNKIVVSVAVNYTFEMFEQILLEGTAHLSILPNTPVSIGEGIVIMEDTHSLASEEFVLISELFEKLGLIQTVATEQLGVAGAVAGCGPAFASIFIEALADGGVKYGLTREEAYQFASQVLVGTGKMQLETKEHPGVMKDKVTSPGGTTIKGVTALEKNNFRHAVISALDAIEGN